jgi:hypothetical protein
MCTHDAGFDVDKLDYVQRDQHHIFPPHEPLQNISASTILKNAMVVEDPASGDTQLAFFMEKSVQRAVNNVFEARADMHLNVYQEGCVRPPCAGLPAASCRRETSSWRRLLTPANLPRCSSCFAMSTVFAAEVPFCAHI